MKNTKQKILDCARQMFNDLGYSQVTIRMIATELNMSSGNLNYHFRKREDILEALYFEMVVVFDERVEKLESESISIHFMQMSIHVSMQRMMEYRFFWTDLYNLIKSSQKIKTHFESVREKRVDGYLYLLDYFINQGVLKQPTFSNEYISLIERMIDYSNTWLYASALYSGKNTNDIIIVRSTFQLLLMMYPYFTSSSRKVFRSLYPLQFS